MPDIQTVIETSIIRPGSFDIDICARWRAAEFAVLEASFDEERASLNAFASDQTQQVVLMARCEGEPAGTCLLAPREIDPVHEVSPWLAGLFVAPAYRRRGVGAVLVRAIESEARQRGHTRLYLYTDTAEAYYQRLGWRTIDRANWKGFDTVLMARDLSV